MIYKSFSSFMSLIFPQSEDLVKSSKFILSSTRWHILHDHINDGKILPVNFKAVQVSPKCLTTWFKTERVHVWMIWLGAVQKVANMHYFSIDSKQ